MSSACIWVWRAKQPGDAWCPLPTTSQAHERPRWGPRGRTTCPSDLKSRSLAWLSVAPAWIRPAAAKLLRAAVPQSGPAAWCVCVPRGGTHHRMPGQPPPNRRPEPIHAATPVP